MVVVVVVVQRTVCVFESVREFGEVEKGVEDRDWRSRCFEFDTR